MSDRDPYLPYTVRALDSGGYVVTVNHESQGRFAFPTFAATTLDEALDFLRKQLAVASPPSGAAPGVT